MSPLVNQNTFALCLQKSCSLLRRPFNLASSTNLSATGGADGVTSKNEESCALVVSISCFKLPNKDSLHVSNATRARDLPRIVQAGYRLIPYFIFSPQEGSRSALFAATDPQVPEYCQLLKSDDFPVCAFISQDCNPTNPSEEAHNVETSHKVWEKTFEMIGLPSDAVEKLIEGEEVACRYGAHNE